jgi:hypothetical protein
MAVEYRLTLAGDISVDQVAECAVPEPAERPQSTKFGGMLSTRVWAMEDLFTPPAGNGAPGGHCGYGHYHETYRRVEGEWKISHLVLTRLRKDFVAERDTTPFDRR